MKRYTKLAFIATLLVFTLTACGESYSYERTEIQATVIQCKQGLYDADDTLELLGGWNLLNQNTDKWVYYNSLANIAGHYDYNVTVCIDGSEYTLSRHEEYEVGQLVSVTRVDTYSADKELVGTIYE